MEKSNSETDLWSADGVWKLIGKSKDDALCKNNKDDFKVLSWKKDFKDAMDTDIEYPTFAHKDTKDRLLKYGSRPVDDLRYVSYGKKDDRKLAIYRLESRWDFLTIAAYNETIKRSKSKKQSVTKASPDNSDEEEEGGNDLDKRIVIKESSDMGLRSSIEKSGDSDNDNKNDRTADSRSHSKCNDRKVSPHKRRQNIPRPAVEETSDSDENSSSAADSESDSAYNNKKSPPLKVARKTSQAITEKHRKKIIFARELSGVTYAIVKSNGKYEMEIGAKVPSEKLFGDATNAYVPIADRKFIEAQLVNDDKLDPQKYEVAGSVGYWRGDQKISYWQVILLKLTEDEQEKLDRAREDRNSNYTGLLLASRTQFLKAFKDKTKIKDAEKLFAETECGKEVAARNKAITEAKAANNGSKERYARHVSLDPESIDYSATIDRLRRERNANRKEVKSLEREIEMLRMIKS